MSQSSLQFYQVAILAISCLMVFFGLEKFIKQKPGQSVMKLFVRIIVWGGMAGVALFPRLTNYLAEVIGIEGNINAVVLIGFLLVFLIIFKILSVVERIELDITRLTRIEALSGLRKRSDGENNND